MEAKLKHFILRKTCWTLSLIVCLFHGSFRIYKEMFSSTGVLKIAEVILPVNIFCYSCYVLGSNLAISFSKTCEIPCRFLHSTKTAELLRPLLFLSINIVNRKRDSSLGISVNIIQIRRSKVGQSNQNWRIILNE